MEFSGGSEAARSSGLLLSLTCAGDRLNAAAATATTSSSSSSSPAPAGGAAATVAGLKMEFPGPSPVYGHGFGPPVGLVLDLSPKTMNHHHHQASFNPTGLTSSGERNGEPGTSLLATVSIKREVKTEEPTGDEAGATGPTTDDEDDDAAVDEEEEASGCSRTLPRMPEAWRLHRLQREQVQVIQPSSAPAAAAAAANIASSPVDVKPPKAVIHPQNQPHKGSSPSASGGSGSASSSASSAIPVGIAVARQRADKPRRSNTPLEHSGKQQRRPVKSPRPSNHHPGAPPVPPPPDLFITGSPLPPPLPLAPPPGLNAYYSSAALGFPPPGTPPVPSSWPWSAPLDPIHFGSTHHHHSFWPPPAADHHVSPAMMSYSGYPPPHAGPPHHHHHHPTASGLTPPPFLLIPATCLDPYQRTAAAMLWPAGYANPPQTPWGLPAEHHPPTPLTPWSLSRSAFELPSLRPEVNNEVGPTIGGADPDDDVKPAIVLDARQTAPPSSTIEIKEERISPGGLSPPPSSVGSAERNEASSDGESLDLVTVDPPVMEREEEEEVEHAPEDLKKSCPAGPPPASPPPSEFSGLQLLSDVMANQPRQTEELDRQPDRRSSLETGSNSLDVLCAAALSQQVDPPAPSPPSPPPPPPAPSSAVAMKPRATGAPPPPPVTSMDDITRTRTPVTPTTSHAPSLSPAFPMEFDFRSKLAELQRKYKEKQKELSNLRCKRKSTDKKEKRSKEGKKRRRSSAESDERKSKKKGDVVGCQQSVKLLAPADVKTHVAGGGVSAVNDFISPGRLDLHATSSSSHRPSRADEEVKVEPRIQVSYAAALASAAVSSSTSSSPTLPSSGTTPPPPPSSSSSSSGGEKKKRKPDFPVRKPDAELTSETIVPLSKKRKFLQLFQWCHSTSTASPDHHPADHPPPAKASKKRKSPTCGNTDSAPPASSKPKIKPKLKAEVQVKRISSSSSSASSGGEEDDEELNPAEDVGDHLGDGDPTQQLAEEDESQRLERHCLPALQYLQLSDDSGAELDAEDPTPSPPPPPVLVSSPPVPETAECSTESDEAVPDNSPWLLSQEMLQDGLRVLIAEEGLFRAGSVTCIRPPDIYGVVVDGERCSRPRILPTEELLNDALLEVKPVGGLAQLPIGTRVCAYWSPKSRCLYPGVVSNLYPAVPSTGHRSVTREDEIDVEFDDGDSGRIPISQIRVLPPDYPVTETVPSPLLALEGRRKRRISNEPPSVASFIPVGVAVKQQSKAEAAAAADNSIIKSEDGTNDHVSITTSEVALPQKKSKKSKKHKKKHKKRRKSDNGVSPTPDLGAEPQDDDLIIPVSPGLAIDPTPDGAEEEASTRGSKESLDYPVSPCRVKSMKPLEGQRKSSSKKAVLLPERQLWEWMGPSFKRASKGKGRKEFYKAIQRGEEIIRVGDCAVFLSAGRSDRPYVGRIELLWQSWGGSMTVKVRWFYHPEETCGGRRLAHLQVPGALFESNHVDENDVQTISHCCTVSSLEDYRLNYFDNVVKPDVNLNEVNDAGRSSSGYDHFYLAGFYDPTSGHLSFEPGVLEQPPPPPPVQLQS